MHIFPETCCTRIDEVYHIWLKYWRWTSPRKASTDPMENSKLIGFLLLATNPRSILSIALSGESYWSNPEAD